jgi:hypothetical protein
MADEPKTHTDMLVKKFPVDLRVRAVSAADNRKENMTVWVARAFERQLAVEAGDDIWPPGKPLVNEPVNYPPPPRLTVDLTGFAERLNAVTAAFTAAGKPVPAGIPRDASALLRAWMREARGLPPVVRRRGLMIEG